MMAVLSISERDQESGVGNRLHLREKPFRVERSAGPATKPARRKKGRFSALLACSSCSRMMRPRGTPVSRAVCVSHSARSSGSLTVSVLLICSNCNTSGAMARVGDSDSAVDSALTRHGRLHAYHSQIRRGKVPSSCQHRLPARFCQGVHCTISKIQLCPVPHALSKTPERRDRQPRLNVVKRNDVTSKFFDELIQQRSRSRTKPRVKNHSGFQQRNGRQNPSGCSLDSM